MLVQGTIYRKASTNPSRSRKWFPEDDVAKRSPFCSYTSLLMCLVLTMKFVRGSQFWPISKIEFTMIYPYGSGIYDIFGQYNKHLETMYDLWRTPDLWPPYSRRKYGTIMISQWMECFFFFSEQKTAEKVHLLVQPLKHKPFRKRWAPSHKLVYTIKLYVVILW